MSDLKSNLAQNIIKDYLDSEGSLAAHEACTVRFTAALQYEDLSMIDAIATRFSDTRTNLVSDVLSKMTHELFLCLPSHERHQVAEIAQDFMSKHEEKNNFTSNGQNKWSFYAKELDKNA